MQLTRHLGRHLGVHGSVLAVTSQTPGPDSRFGTDDDLLTPLNLVPVHISLDVTPGTDCQDSRDPVRSFYNCHPDGANFIFTDAPLRFISNHVAPSTYRVLNTIAGTESVDGEL